MTTDKVELRRAIDHWRDLAKQERAKLAQRPDTYAASKHRAALYDRCANSLELELQTGKPHCVDHLEPLPCRIHQQETAKR